MSTEQLIIELDAKTAKLDAKLKKVERNLDHVDGSTKKTDKSLISMSKAGEIAGRGITAVATAGLAASAAITAATRAAVVYGKELKIAANRSGENVERLQSLAFATKTVGIDLNKLGDITKDTQERLGEFTKDGTGGFNDFVSVAGLTKDEARLLALEFQHLSGTQVLQEMVKRMEEAGATSQEMSFALEGVASDTTDLIPLLVDGGEKLAVLEKEFDDLKITLTALDIERISKLGIETAKLGEVAKGSSAKAVSVLSEEIIQITELLAGSAQDMAGLVVKAVTGYQVIVQEGAAWIANLFRESEIVALKAKSKIVGIFGDNTELEAEIAKLTKSDALRDAFDVKFIEEKWAKAQASVAEYYGEIKTQEEDAPPITTPITGEEDSDTRDSGLNPEKLEALREFSMTRAELLDQQLVDDLARLALAGEQLGIAEGDQYSRRLEIIQDFANKKEALEKKELKNKDKNLKTENKWSTSANKKLMDQGTDLLTSLGNNSKTAHKIKQGLAASNAFMNTAEGVTDALADQNYPSAALIAATGAAQIAAILASSPDSPSGSITAPSAAAPEQPQERFSAEQSEIGLDFRSEESSTSNVIRFDTETGDQLIDALMGVMNDSIRNGRG